MEDTKRIVVREFIEFNEMGFMDKKGREYELTFFAEMEIENQEYVYLFAVQRDKAGDEGKIAIVKIINDEDGNEAFADLDKEERIVVVQVWQEYVGSKIYH